MTKEVRWTDSEYIVGIDEAGRGPLAGPVTIGISYIPKKESKRLFLFLKNNGLNDSKKVKESDRENLFKLLLALKKAGKLNWAVISVSAHIISTKGIVYAIDSAIKKGIAQLGVKEEKTVLEMDGALKIPEGSWKKAQSIIKGDSTHPSIMIASIIAKVTRDAYMVRIAKKYPEYGFELHKGYGTKKHRELIKKNGLSKLHRTGWYKGQ